VETRLTGSEPGVQVFEPFQDPGRTGRDRALIERPTVSNLIGA